MYLDSREFINGILRYIDNTVQSASIFRTSDEIIPEENRIRSQYYPPHINDGTIPGGGCGGVRQYLCDKDLKDLTKRRYSKHSYNQHLVEYLNKNNKFGGFYYAS